MYGAGQGATHVVFLTVGTGIGGAVVIDGKLFNGYANRGTEPVSYTHLQFAGFLRSWKQRSKKDYAVSQ